MQNFILFYQGCTSTTLLYEDDCAKFGFNMHNIDKIMLYNILGYVSVSRSSKMLKIARSRVTDADATAQGLVKTV